ncbi:nuclease-related domain-containing protein [Alteribacter keqinensis]|uniref:nuclease-related domain-containing protein n=1 Tax=Alteribacter keqinensis TaxID=2483800 RepID=UPI001606BE29|nr:nuclease-related domain-containing protein [Alteribacter keqinensis]
MIKKNRSIPLALLIAEAAHRRTPPLHPRYPYIKKDHRNFSSGYKGESSVDYYLKNCPLSSSYIYHNLRFERPDDEAFEMDVLLTFPGYLLILEVKHYSGEPVTLKADPHQLTWKSYEKKKNTFDDPILQVKQQKKQLQLWLRTNNLPPMPVEYFVVMANPHCEVILSPSYKERDRVIRPSYLEYLIYEFDQKHKKSILTEGVLRDLDQALLSQHRELFKPGMERYNVSFEELKKGVHCPDCKYLKMRKVHRTWECAACGFYSKEVLLDTLKDYYLKTGKSITNQLFSQWCEINNRKTIKKTFKRLDLNYDGETKARRYFLGALIP